jgi:hypothetical protein
VKSIKIGAPDCSTLAKTAGLHRSERDLPVVLPCTTAETLTLKVSLPEKLQPKALPREIKIDNPVGKASQTAVLKDGVLTVTRSVAIPATLVPSAQWGDLRAIANTLAADPARLIIF